jgi:hypothetical protein
LGTELNQKTPATHLVEYVRMDLAGRRKYDTTRSAVSLVAFIEFGHAAVDHQIKRGEIVSMPGNLETRGMTGFRPKKPGYFLFAEVILPQALFDATIFIELRPNLLG